MYAARPSPAGFGWFYKVVFAFAHAGNRQVSAIKNNCGYAWRNSSPLAYLFSS
jgi:hypothetical protein